MPIEVVGGIELYVEVGGDGPRTLFLNGSSATVEDVGMLLAPLRERLTVATFDHRGIGRSAEPDGPYAMADCAADAAGVLDHLGWPTARVVGISFGGMVAQELAVTWPDRIDRLALLSTSPGGDAPSYPLDELADLDGAAYAARMAPLMDTRLTPERLADHPEDRAVVDLLARRRDGRSASAARGEALQLEARRAHDVGDRLGAVTCPTLVAVGRYDGIAPQPNSERIVEAIPDAELRVFEGGHLLAVQDPTALPAIVEFLAG